MQLFLQRLFDALANGAVYAALAVGLAIVYRSTAMLNFALGELSMAATFLALVLSADPTPLLPGTLWASRRLGTPWPLWLVIPVTMLAAMALGATVEALLVRRVERRSAMAVVGVTLGVGMLVTGAAGQVYGSRFYSMPSPFPLGADAQWRIGGARLRYDTVGIVGVLTGVLVIMWLLQRTTKLGLAFRAVASNQESASLAGVPVGRVLALGWGCAGALGALAGALVANNVLVSTSMMTRLLVFALAAATIGGLDSPMGAALGGLIVALLETMLGGYVPFIGGDISIVAALVVLSAVLVLRPAGLMGRRATGRI